VSMKRELWVRWKCPVIIGKPGKTCHFQIVTDHEGNNPQPQGVLALLLEHLRYTKKFEYRVEGKYLIIEHPFEPGPNIDLRKELGQKRAASFCCTVEYFKR